MRASTQAGVLLLLAGMAQFARAQQAQPDIGGEIEVLPVQGNVYLLAGAISSFRPAHRGLSLSMRAHPG
jgi:hypothetical protein